MDTVAQMNRGKQHKNSHIFLLLRKNKLFRIMSRLCRSEARNSKHMHTATENKGKKRGQGIG